MTSSVRHFRRTPLPIPSITTHTNSTGSLLGQMPQSKCTVNCTLHRLGSMRTPRFSPSCWTLRRLTRMFLELLQPSCSPQMQHFSVHSLHPRLGRSTFTLETNQSMIWQKTRFCLLPPPSGSFPTLGPPCPRVGRSWYGPKWQVQGDPVTLEKSSPSQTTWAGVQPRPHHFLPTFFNTNFRVVKATVNPPIPQTLVKWPGRVTGTQRKGVRPE